MENLLDSLKDDLPEECIQQRQRFEACKDAEDPDYDLNTPLSRTKNCRGQWQKYHTCVRQFHYRYMTLKNIEAKVNGKHEAYDIQAYLDSYDRNITSTNFGLDKF